MKQLPNLFTLFNLLFGCLAVVYALQPGLVPLYISDGALLTPDVTDAGVQYVSIPESMFMASLFIGLAAVVDFFDGFVARWLKATSAIGAQLDSLADVVSFGVAPSCIIYEFLRLSFAQQNNGLNVKFIFLVPAFIIACAGAYRLARFNVENTQTSYFTGVPIPANGLLIASFPLIYWTSNQPIIIKILINPWFWYGIIVVLSWLMVSKKPTFALKFTNISIKKLMPFIIIAVVAIVGAFMIKWLTVPVCFLLYVILSLFIKQSNYNDI